MCGQPFQERGTDVALSRGTWRVANGACPILDLSVRSMPPHPALILLHHLHENHDHAAWSPSAPLFASVPVPPHRHPAALLPRSASACSSATMTHFALFVFNAFSVPTSSVTRYTTSFLSPLRVATTAPFSISPRFVAPNAPPIVPEYRRIPVVASRRSRRRSSVRWPHSLQNAWRNANSNERFAIVVASFAAVAFAGTLLNVVFHVSLFLAVTAISLIAAPLLFLIMLSFTAFTVGVLMTTGFGFMIFGAPFFTVGLMAKMIFPLLAFVGGVSFIATRVLPFGRRSEDDDVADPVIELDEQDEFERFDDTLKTRVTGSRAINVESWGLNEVVDELDFSGLGEYRQLFIEERIDGHTLLSLSDDDVKAEFGRSMPLGDRKRLIRLIARLRRRTSRL